MYSNQVWNVIMREEILSEYFKSLMAQVDYEYQNFLCYPKKDLIFNAIKLTSFDQIKVVIIGQDPYINENQAHGLAFSVLCQELPPSLRNIYQEIENDLNIKMDFRNGNLTHWANQGVLLLNSILTVRSKQSLSHKYLNWEWFTDSLIKKINLKKQPVVFILWGNNARSKKKFITNSHHFIIESPHPSPLSAYQGFFHSKPFSKANQFLKEKLLTEIDWKI